jgi:hypothetical protein
MAMTPIDPSKVQFTGENSFIRLKESADGPDTTVVAHWRGLISPGGPGHVLFIQSDATDGKIKVYADSESFARWIQILEETLHPKTFADKSLPIIKASFSRSGDFRSSYTETAESAEGKVVMTWSEIGEPYLLRLDPNNDMTRQWGVYSCLTPVGKATLTVNGKAAKGRTFPDKMAGHPSGTSCLAWSETWLK